MLSHFSRVQLFTSLQTVTCQDPLSMELSRKEYWSRLPCPSPGDLLDPGIKPTSLVSPTLGGEFFTISATWEVCKYVYMHVISIKHFFVVFLATQKFTLQVNCYQHMKMMYIWFIFLSREYSLLMFVSSFELFISFSLLLKDPNFYIYTLVPWW